MSVAAYVRISTSGQNKAGQRREIRKWLKGNGIDLKAVRWFEDEASGENMDRPAWKELEAAVFQGEIKTLVIWKLDRLSRSLQNGVATLGALCDRGVRVISTTQQLDLSGTVGQIIAAVLLGLAQIETEYRRERQKAGIDAARARGKYLGRRTGTFKKSPKRAVALRKKGLTLDEIATALNVNVRTVSRYLRVS